MDASVLRYVGAGIATFALFGVALGLGKIFAAVCDAIGRNPSAKADLFTIAMIGGGFTEAIGLLAFVIAFMILIGN
ncbi:MAG: F0F1 ATP synthase subunit C [Holosporales bacterium]|jgi:F-type H+-transporting ATPase subunit c|nr:F0F1 ATP synthase subunit C [Holosporales bacterium]